MKPLFFPGTMRFAQLFSTVGITKPSFAIWY